MTRARAFPLLDGIRGICAALVVIRHTDFMWHYQIGRSYLAVDLFFVLSGFVVTHAYDRRLASGEMSRSQFVITRLIRLYPMYALSITLCAIAALAWSSDAVPWLVAIALASCFLPSHVGGSALIFPLNVSFWSLFFELGANFLYGAIRSAMTSRRLWIAFVVLAAANTLVAYQVGKLDTGFTWGGWSIVGGWSRSLFGMCAGWILYRERESLTRRLPRWLLAPAAPWLAGAGILVLLVSPATTTSVDWLIDTVVVSELFPLFMLIAARGDAGRAHAACLSLGAASYPIYVLLVPIAAILAHDAEPWISAHAPYSGLAFIAAMFMCALIVERVYDLPIRAWLGARMLPGNRPASSA
jgi:peptidoglycan/LPS O-acetylase OafA/YrhL